MRINLACFSILFQKLIIRNESPLDHFFLTFAHMGILTVSWYIYKYFSNQLLSHCGNCTFILFFCLHGKPQRRYAIGAVHNTISAVCTGAFSIRLLSYSNKRAICCNRIAIKLRNNGLAHHFIDFCTSGCN